MQQEDEKLKRLFQRVSSSTNKFLVIINGILFFKSKQGQHQLMIPQNLTEQIVKETHEQYGHMGTFKIYQLLRNEYQFSNMYRTIKQFIRSCDTCQRAKVNNQLSRGPMLSILPEEPLQVVSLDPTAAKGTRRNEIYRRIYGHIFEVYSVIPNQTSHYTNYFKEVSTRILTQGGNHSENTNR